MANSSFTKGTIETPVPADKGGTGLSSLGTAGQSLKVNDGATGLEWGQGGHTGTSSYIANAAGYLTCGTAGSVANFQAISDGGFKTTIDGTERAIGSLDFSDTPWNIDMTSDSISSNSLATQMPTNGPYGVRFSSDGTKMYSRSNEVGNYKIFQYTLSTAWDLTTSSSAGKDIDLSSRTTDATDFWFSPDGTKMFVFGGTGGNDYCWRWNLSTAWELNTASYHSVSPQFTQSSNTSGGILSDDGLFLYNFDNNSNAIDRYSLATAWNITSVTYLGQTSTEGRFGASGAQWSHSGRYFWYIIYGPTGFDNYYVYRWTCETPYDLGSVTKYTTRGFAFGDGDCFAFKPDGTKFYICDNSADVVRQYDAQSDVQDAFDVARTAEDAIQTVTSSTEKVDYDTNHYVVTSATEDADSQVSVMSAPDSGTDVTGTSYFNGATNGTATAGTGGEGYVPTLDSDGRIDPSLVGGGSFGTQETKSNSTVYTAETDGLVYGYSTAEGSTCVLYSDSNATPTTVVTQCQSQYSNGQSSFCGPVKKGNNWRVVNGSFIRFMPIGN